MPKCYTCKKPIQGEYIKFGRRSYHPGCFCCAACGKPIVEPQFMTKDRQPYHPTCYQELFSPVCAGCGQKITGKHITALGKFWHPEHFVCTICKKPFNNKKFFLHEDKPYCEKDYFEHFGIKCDVCGKPIKGSYKIDGWGNKICSRHDKAPRCFSCGRVINKELTGGGVTYQDGRHICNHCRQTSIDSPEKAHKSLVRVAKALSKMGLTLNAEKIPIQLVGQQQINRAARARTRHPAGLTRTNIKTINGKVTERKLEHVLMLYGLPTEHFEAVLAHELGHVWLFNNHFPKLSKSAEEGFCELISALWLEQQNTPEAQYRLQGMLENEDKAYGSGYRTARKALRKRSLSQLLDYMREHQRLPRA